MLVLAADINMRISDPTVGADLVTSLHQLQTRLQVEALIAS